MARDRREASLNASAKMQLLFKQDDPAHATGSSSSFSSPTQRSAAQSRAETGQPSSTADDPILRTIEEVIAQSSSASVPVNNQQVPFETSSIMNGRRKQAMPHRRIKPKQILKSPSSGRKSKSKSPGSRPRRSKSPHFAPNGTPLSDAAGSPLAHVNTGNPSCDVSLALPALSDGVGSPSVSLKNANPPLQLSASRSPSVGSTGGSSGKIIMTRRSPRIDSPTRYSLVINPSTSVNGINIKSSTDQGTTNKRKRSESRNTPPKKEKLANLLKKRKTLATLDDPPVVNISHGKSAKSRSDKGNITGALLGKRKLQALMSKKGEKSVWSWRGRPFTKTIYSEAEKSNVSRSCYTAVKHVEGDVIKVGDCVLLRAPKGQKPHVGKIAAFWENESGDMMMTIFWYWRPEEVETRLRPPCSDMEIYVSNLRDENFVGCVDEKCYVLTARQYAYFMAQVKEGEMLYHRPKQPLVPTIKSLIFDGLPDKDTDPDVIYFADRGYDGKHKRFWAYYFRGNRLRKYPLDLD